MLTKFMGNGFEIADDSGDIKEAFKFLAAAQEVFGQRECGNCGKKGPFKFIHRVAQENDFYECQCPDCKHSLRFGQTKIGKKLFPKSWEPPYNRGNSNNEDMPY